MVKPKGNMTLYQCNLCGLASKNHFIFKRHRNRCVRVHKMKEQAEAAGEDMAEPWAEELAAQNDVSADLDQESLLGPPVLVPEVPRVGGSGQGRVSVLNSLVHVDPSEETAPLVSELMALRASKNSSAQPSSSGGGGTLGGLLTRQLSKSGTSGASGTSGKASSGGHELPPPVVSRNYRCERCNFNTTKSKSFLYHQLEAHNAKFSIFPCYYCEYATRYKHKLARHIKVAHKCFVSTKDLEAENSPSRGSDRQARGGSSVGVRLVPPLKVILPKPRGLEGGLSVKLVPGRKAGAYVQELPAPGRAVRFKCKLCLYSGRTRQHVIKHVNSCHINSKTFRCGKCNYQTRHKIEFYMHQSQEHPNSQNEVFRCTECNYSSEFKPNFDRHMANHTGEPRPFKCTICNYSTLHEGAVKRHMTNHHPNNAENVSLVFAQEGIKQEPCDINDGEVVAKEVGMDDDDDIFNDNEVAVEEEELVGENGVEPGVAEDSSGSGPDANPCPICGLTYKRSSDLNRHMKSKHNMRLRDLVPRGASHTAVAEEGGDWSSSMEDGEGKEMLMAAGGRMVVPLTGTKSRCTYCSYIAKWPSDLRRHMAVHSIEKRFKCPMCWKKYKYLGDLNVHLRRDHQKEPGTLNVETVATVPMKKSSPQQFRCPACTFTTSWKSEMEKHSHQHNNEKTYQCKLCTYQTYWRGDIGRHIYRHHSDKVEGDTDVKLYILMRPECKAITKMKLAEGTDIKPTDLGEMEMEGVEEGQGEELQAAGSRDGQYTCSQCAFTTFHMSKMKSHEATHADLRQFMCPECGRRSNWKWDLQKHLKKDHPSSDKEVVKLSVEEASATITEYMIQNPTPYRREVHPCPSPSASSHSHSPSPGPSSTHPSTSSCSGGGDVKPAATVGREFGCSLCKYKSPASWCVTKHIQMGHQGQEAKVVSRLVTATPAAERSMTISLRQQQERTPVKRFAIDDPEPDKKFKCAQCGKKGVLQGDIKKHYHYIHPNMEVRIINVATQEEFSFNGSTPIPIKSSKKDQGAVGKDMGSGSAGQTASHNQAASQAAGYVDAFLCRVCNFQSAWRSCVSRHLREKHSIDDMSKCLKIRKRKMVETAAGKAMAKPIGPPPTKMRRQDSEEGNGKKFQCSICPYRASKRGLLDFHMINHVAKKQNRFKCKYCPYYVCAPRLLHQHQRLHQNQRIPAGHAAAPVVEKVVFQQPNKVPPSRSLSVSSGHSAMPGVGKKHQCEKCPYATNSKNDYLYHKQFHRVKPSAEYKCDYCDYWVTHRRLLKQHIKLHEKGVRYPPPSTPQRLAPSQSVTPSPAKSELSETSVIMDTVETAAYKQSLILSKITSSLSVSPSVSPMKLATRVAVGNRPGYVLKNGVYKKLHKCQYCPYTICKKRNLRLHESMHGSRDTDRKLYKCPHCDYHVGSSGLLSHHLKVHAPGYRPYGLDISGDPALKTAMPSSSNHALEKNGEEEDSNSDSMEIPAQQKVDTLLEITRMKKYACEKCPYATAKRIHFQRHSELHGSRQRFTCDFCDYSVPSNNLLTQHRKIHMMPNQNLLASQSLSNLQHLPEVPADMALACALPPLDTEGPVLISVIHDHLNLYENRDSYVPPCAEPQKLYRCERCPYANVKREHLITHMRYHNTKSAHECLYCDYSAPKKTLLTQHLGLHFCPLPETTEDEVTSGQCRGLMDSLLAEVMHIHQLVEEQKKRQSMEAGAASAVEEAEKTAAKGDAKDAAKDAASSDKHHGAAYRDAAPSGSSESVGGGEEGAGTSGEGAEPGAGRKELYICSYCDRQFPESTSLLEHTMQHMIGNHYEVAAKGRMRQAGKGETRNSLDSKLEKCLRRRDAARPKSTDTETTPADKKDAEAKKRTTVKVETEVEPMEEEKAAVKEEEKAAVKEEEKAAAKEEEKAAGNEEEKAAGNEEKAAAKEEESMDVTTPAETLEVDAGPSCPEVPKPDN